MERDTIVALSTPRGRGAIALIRLSGPDASTILAEALKTAANSLEARRVQRGFFHDRAGARLDEVLTVFFSGPASYTGEDVAEISCHGSPWLVRRILEECLGRGARLAHPGEFTRRAFINGRIDLLQAEAVRDLINSETSFQADLARRQLEGQLSRTLGPIREELIAVACHLETTLEFVEDDVSPEGRAELAARLSRTRSTLEKMVASWHRGQVIREGAKAVLAGCPNSGKSSIFNYLVREERALVSARPGTTRDALREFLDLGGMPVWLYDTAGIREADDEIEGLGISRSRAVVRDADLVLFVVDQSKPLTDDDFRIWDGLGDRPRITVWNKSDLPARCAVPEGREELTRAVVKVSALTGRGMDALAERIGRLLGEGVGEGTREREGAVLSNLRQKDCVEKSCAAIARAEQGLDDGLSEEFVCYDLRNALNALEDLVGATTTDDVLARIFSTFCIGK